MSNRTRILALVALLAVCCPALGYHINGNATGDPYQASNGQYTVFLQPRTVITQTASNDQWLINALAAENFDQLHGWTVRYHGLTLDGGYTVGTYKAWADSYPTFTQGAITIPAGNRPGSGGQTQILHKSTRDLVPAALSWGAYGFESGGPTGSLVEGQSVSWSLMSTFK